jgi:hypothetical protein
MIESHSETTNVAFLKQVINSSEQAWLKWKANKCFNYELPKDQVIKAKL